VEQGHAVDCRLRVVDLRLRSGLGERDAYTAADKVSSTNDVVGGQVVERAAIAPIAPSPHVATASNNARNSAALTVTRSPRGVDS
jgi:hypothetical protein